MPAPSKSSKSIVKVTTRWPSLLISREVIFAEDVERIFGKRPWVSRSQEIIEENQPKDIPLEQMPDFVKQAQADFDEQQANNKEQDASNKEQEKEEEA